ncbi:MAG: ABC transporter permease [Muribaculaceae bacterium]|nr:ABC transporter permease [Muribaculaceae bacterium]
MNKLGLIIAREYMSIVGRKSFIFVTLGMPLLFILIMAVPIGLAYLNDKGSDVQQIAVIDETGRYAAALHSDDMYHFVAIKGDTVTNAREFYDKANGSLDAIVIIPHDVDSTGAVNIYSEGTITPAMVMNIRNALTDTIESAHLAEMGIPNIQQMVEKAHVNVDVRSIKWSESGEQESSTDVAMGLGFMLSLITYMFVLMYGAMIMNSVIEEKTNRIVEVVVSSCRPFQLMLGKIIGVGLVGLTQMAIWIVLLAIVGTVASSVFGISNMSSPDAIVAGTNAGAAVEAATDAGVMDSFMREVLSINYVPIILNFLLYFIGGYLLYSSLFAGLGSAVDQPSDSSQFVTPVIMIMLIAFYAGMVCMENPTGPTAVWCSIIPFTSPVVMMVRLPFGVPTWQLILSLALLFGTALAITWLAARIYRRGILHYGQKASLKDLFKWMK